MNSEFRIQNWVRGYAGADGRGVAFFGFALRRKKSVAFRFALFSLL